MESRSSSRTTTVEWYHPQFVSPFLDECVLGIDAAANDLIQRLKEGELRRSVISLLGTGGIGKTTLAKKVFNNEVVREHFEFQAWINVSQSYKVEELLKILVMDICTAGQHYVGKVKTMQSRELIRILMQFFMSKMYFLVFDGIWEKEFWPVVKDALPDDQNGSRIIITTRSEKVAASCKESLIDHVHMVEPLSQTRSWDLFCRIAFQDGPEHRCPPELEHLSAEIFEICKGLPLATIVIGGLLSTKEKTVSEWQRQLDGLYFELISDPHLSNASKIIAFSFDDLAPQLKLCFQYFSIYPEDSLVASKELFKLWIAEGFVEEKRGKSLEEVAEEYLYKLIQRNMVQAFELFNGLEKFCRAPSVMLDMARVKADGFGFCQNWKLENTSFSEKGPGLSTYKDVNVMKHISSLTLPQKFSYLMVLDLENSPLECLPEEVGNLLHLRYLSLKNTNLRNLPESVAKLRNLETLNLKNTLLIELPTWISKLRKLRHLFVYHYGDKNTWEHPPQGVVMKEAISCLEKLQKLMIVEVHHGCIDLKKELFKLQHLRTLRISGLTAEFAGALCATIEKMNNLEFLRLYAKNKDEYCDFGNISSPPRLLKRLVLFGRLHKFPDWISSLHSLRKLFLCHSRLSDDPLRYLYVLPNLESLSLYRAYDGDRLRFEDGGFRKLKMLALRELHGLRVLEIETAALPRLEVLQIGPSPLMNVPVGINHLENLKLLAHYDMPTEFVLCMQPDGGADYWKVAHVPAVEFWYGVRGRRYVSFKLGARDLLEHLLNEQHDIQYYSHDDDDIASTSTSIVTWHDVYRSSFSSYQGSVFSDDIEE